jgi:hypothetical protein
MDELTQQERESLLLGEASLGHIRWDDGRLGWPTRKSGVCTGCLMDLDLMADWTPAKHDRPATIQEMIDYFLQLDKKYGR